MRVIAAVAATVVGLVGWFAEPASAGGPAGSAATCPPSFDAMTLPAILAQAAGNGVPEQVARSMFRRVDKNDDGWICQKRMLSPLPNHYTFVDNQAVGLDE